MSNTTDLKLPALDEAVGTLDAVYADIFFSKMAEYGYHPQTQEDMVSMLETAAYLDTIDTSEKTASAGVFADANAKLKQAMAAEGLLNPAQLVQEETLGIKQAAFAMAQEPALYTAVLTLKAAQNQGA